MHQGLIAKPTANLWNSQMAIAIHNPMANNSRTMTLTEWTAAQRGRSLQLARALGVTPPVVSDWCTGKKRVPFEQCMPIEVATSGEVTRRDLKPDEYLRHWPELADAHLHPHAPAPAPAQEPGVFGAVDRCQRHIEPHPDLERRAPLAAKLAGA